jgi:hypothetical protein
MNILELGKVSEQQRIRMGLAKRDYCKQICVSYNTYSDFLKLHRKVSAKTLFSIIMFLERQGRVIGDLNSE